MADVGLDLGSTGLRVAWTADDGSVRDGRLAEEHWSWPRCETVAGGPLPVAFWTAKERLGRSPAAVTEVAGALARVRRMVEEDTGGRVGSLVVSVPFRFGSAARGALREAAAGAGLPAPRLLSDAVAAVLGREGGGRARTYLVHCLGYGGYETAVVRRVRDSCRTLAHEGVTVPSGSLFDLHLLYALTGFVRPSALSEGDWLTLRAQVASARERLGTSPRPVPVYLDPRRGRGVLLDREHVEALYAHYAPAVRRLTAEVLDRAGVTAGDVDTVLLTGGCTAAAGLREVFAAGHDRLTDGTPELPARGALAYASGLDAPPAPFAEAPADPTVTLPAPALPELRPAPSVPPPQLAEARRLLDRRQFDAAVKTSHLAWELRPLDPDVFEEMLAVHIDAANADGVDPHAAERWLGCALLHDPSDTRVRTLLAARLYARAVTLATEDRPTEAREALTKCVSLEPDHRRAQALLERLGG
ncbi:Chaperone protein HscA [Streptomyces sp. RB5]|uniref:Chaperone protein HscA n=1 Tax=Streptomyces smaragdinus TaxID=2585196 RepID=A0A7K0CGJ7_9ACTN|nr:Hsp70 family protein [Streptomyces smaragdinus]MQY12595.1 Chaperone protein HscA [Streptomyces smaragdinus]